MIAPRASTAPSNSDPLAARIAREVRRFVDAALITRAERTNAEPDGVRTRRRVIVALTLAAGAATLGWALSIKPGDPLFYPATLGVAAVWTVGALASGPLRLGSGVSRHGDASRGVVQGIILGAALLAVFLAGAVVVSQIPILRGPVEGLLDHARFGSLGIVALVTAITGAAEELFFRGAAYAALPPRFNGIGSALLYASSTLFSGVPLLTFAAFCLGLLTAAQRRVTGGVLGPIASHLTWSLGMLFLMPWAFSLGG